MPAESTTPEFLELLRRAFWSVNQHDADALVIELANGEVARLAVYPTDIDEARAVAERLAGERR